MKNNIFKDEDSFERFEAFAQSCLMIGIAVVLIVLSFGAIYLLFTR